MKNINNFHLTLQRLKKTEVDSELIRWFKSKNETNVFRLVAQLRKEKPDWWIWGTGRLIACCLNHEQQVRYAVYAAELVRGYVKRVYPKDRTVQRSIETARRWLADPSKKNAERARIASWQAHTFSSFLCCAADAAAAAARAAQCPQDSTCYEDCREQVLSAVSDTVYGKPRVKESKQVSIVRKTDAAFELQIFQHALKNILPKNFQSKVTPSILKIYLDRKLTALDRRLFLSYGTHDGLKILKGLIKKKEFHSAHWLLDKFMSIEEGVHYHAYLAERVLPYFERVSPQDPRPRRAIEFAKNFKPLMSGSWVSRSRRLSEAADKAGQRITQARLAARTASLASFAIHTDKDGQEYGDLASGEAGRIAEEFDHDNRIYLKIFDYGLKLLKN